MLIFSLIANRKICIQNLQIRLHATQVDNTVFAVYSAPEIPEFTNIDNIEKQEAR